MTITQSKGTSKNFFESQKPFCNIHSFPSHGNPHHKTVSAVFETQDQADVFYHNTEKMEKAKKDNWVWNPRLSTNKKGVISISFKLTREFILDTEKLFNDDTIENQLLYYDKGKTVCVQNDMREGMEVFAGIVKLTPTNQQALAMSKIPNIGMDYEQCVSFLKNAKKAPLNGK